MADIGDEIKEDEEISLQELAREYMCLGGMIVPRNKEMFPLHSSKEKEYQKEDEEEMTLEELGKEYMCLGGVIVPRNKEMFPIYKANKDKKEKI